LAPHAATTLQRASLNNYTERCSAVPHACPFPKREKGYEFSDAEAADGSEGHREPIPIVADEGGPHPDHGGD
jgi:hypothetical protein